MTLQEVIEALERVKEEFKKKGEDIEYISRVNLNKETKGGYYRVGNIAIKIAEITELK